MSYIIGNDQLSYQSATRVTDASLAMGYKFNVDSFEASDTQSRVNITNTGIAPLYYDAYPAANGTRSTTSIKGLLPGASLEFLIELGGDNPMLTIESDYLVAGQVIEYSTL